MLLCSASATLAARPEDGNEDSLLADDAHGLYVVSDGVGRYKGAAVASELVVATVGRELQGDPPADEEARRTWLRSAAKKATAALAARAKKDRVLSSMSATLTALRVVGDEGLLLHVGDSRAYRLRDGRFEQLTRDHSLAFEQFEAGAITKEQLRTHPNQKLLTRTIRASSTIVLPEIGVVDVRAGDRYLLCSDGLTKDLADERIGELLGAGAEPRAACEALLAATREAGQQDDTTVIVVDPAAP